MAEKFFKQNTARDKNLPARTNKLVDRVAAGKLFDASSTTVIKNRTGIYDRPASILVQKACEFDADIRFKSKGKVVDAKSILYVMSLGLQCGNELTILASGKNAQRAVDELIALIDSGFGEKMS